MEKRKKTPKQKSIKYRVSPKTIMTKKMTFLFLLSSNLFLVFITIGSMEGGGKIHFGWFLLAAISCFIFFIPYIIIPLLFLTFTKLFELEGKLIFSFLMTMIFFLFYFLGIFTQLENLIAHALKFLSLDQLLFYDHLISSFFLGLLAFAFLLLMSKVIIFNTKRNQK